MEARRAETMFLDDFVHFSVGLGSRQPGRALQRGAA
jgi:hypothetical protein